MKQLAAMLLISFVLTGCGTVTVALGTPLSGQADTGEDASTTGGTTGSQGTTGGGTGSTAGSSTGGTGSGTSSGGGSVPVPTSCTPNADTFDNFAKAALQDNCAGCHSGKFDTLSEAKASASNAQSYIANGTMPPGGSLPLDPNTKARLVNWYLCKTP